jgi:peroxiredoxin
MWGKRRKETVEAGVRAPVFTLRNLQGGTTSLDELLARGPALLAFFKISCPVCQLAFPFLERMAHRDGVRIVGISQDDAEATRFFNQKFGITFPTLLDEAGQRYPASNAYGLTSVPALFLVEMDGSVSKAIVGFSKRDMEALGERIGAPPFRPEEKVPEWKAG